MAKIRAYTRKWLRRNRVEREREYRQRLRDARREEIRIAYEGQKVDEMMKGTRDVG